MQDRNMRCLRFRSLKDMQELALQPLNVPDQVIERTC